MTRITDERLKELRDSYAEHLPGLPWNRDLINALNELIEARRCLDEIHSWIVCAAIATPEDMMQNAQSIIELSAPGETA